MLKTRIILVAACALAVWLIFLLPKSVVENEAEMQKPMPTAGDDMHTQGNPEVLVAIGQLKAKLAVEAEKRNSAIFADSLAGLYKKATLFDSAALFAEQANSFFESPERTLKAGEAYFEAFTFAMEQSKRKELAMKSRAFFEKVLQQNANNLDVKTKMALTYFGTGEPPMQGVSLLREVLAQDPKFKPALFNMGMLSVQSGQYGKAIEWLNQLLAISPDDVQGRLLLGVAYVNQGDKEKAREQFEQVKKLDSDPAVQQQADAYLKDLQ
jgi:tetratricopeptide (TPR) repeat protein